MDAPCKVCAQINFVVTEYGSKVCTCCGSENFAHILSCESGFSPYCVPLHSAATYTRLKRFKKYLQRASMEQSQASIPETTWDYLLAGEPYRGPAAIVRRLKKAPKHVRKKCYDSLPLLIKTLCPHLTVPRLTEADKLNALAAFGKLDCAYKGGEPFVSYLFALEYILQLIGRYDVLPYINKICCRKRRAAYRLRLNKIFHQ